MPKAMKAKNGKRKAESGERKTMKKSEMSYIVMKKNRNSFVLPTGLLLLLLFCLPLNVGGQNVCHNDKLCKYKVCIKAEEIYSLLQELGYVHKNTDNTNKTGVLNNDNQPYLVPNPTQGYVSVAGYEGSIVDIAVMDLNGRHVAAFGNTDSFDLSGLRAGMYIIRVRTKDIYNKGKVVYLKLIKE